MSDVPSDVQETRLQKLNEETEEKLRDKDLRIAELESAAKQWELRYDRLLQEGKEEREEHREERKQYQEALLKEKEERREEKSRLEAQLAAAQEQHREEKTRLEAQLAAALGRNERMMQAFQVGTEREGRERAELARERDNMRDTAERDRQALAEEWKGALELEKERAREREADLRAQLAEAQSQLQQQEAQLTEAQSQLRQQEARHAAERREMAETLPLRVEECRAREAIEAAQRAERFSILIPFLRQTLLGRRRVGDFDTLSIGEGLYKLWKDYYKTGVLSQEELHQLLRGETQIGKTYLNIVGRGKWDNPHLTLPQDEVEPFYADVVSQLPKLERFAICALPSVKLYYDPAQPPLPPTVTALQLNSAPYTLEELKRIRARYPRLTWITVNTAKCTNWGEAANIVDMKERQQRVKEILDIGTIDWV